MSAFPSNWEAVPLESVAEVRLGRQRSPKNHEGDHMRPYVRAANVGWRGLLLDDVKQMNFTDSEMDTYRLKVGDLLLNEASGSATEVGKPAVWRGEIDDCAFQNTLIRVRPFRVDSDYLLHYFRNQAALKMFAAASRGVGIHHIGREALASWIIPLPPIEEQRKIGCLLERADAVRAKRREALENLDELERSVYLEMFGDPLDNPMNWPIVRLAEVIASPLRNGLSPTSRGNVPAKILTLSSVTGSSFNPSAYKIASFLSEPPTSQSVRDSDFLICRGNGNLELVGRGFFPPYSMPDTTFPDTIIAARADLGRVRKEFLEHVWSTAAVRSQIEASARTTNGTYKVNQTALEGIAFCLPDIDVQYEFATRIEAIRRVRAAQRASMAELDSLFASLEVKAFRGEL
ncbi:restriction endonuclease subunit S [Dactylosporangium sp. CA-152071]|uniref:restriction endonuclease subunit S n=1 Tax=Dactylosporangium sp. CA-152071 TaxID=3239933 RepID=UPI003D8FC52B